MPQTMDAVQMNIRIDRTLKREGDAALAAAGYTPSQAVRALWVLAVDMRQRPKELESLLSGHRMTPEAQAAADACEENTPPDEDEGLRLHRERMNAIQQRFANLGIDTSIPYVDTESDDEALEAALLERYWEEHQ